MPGRRFTTDNVVSKAVAEQLQNARLRYCWSQNRLAAALTEAGWPVTANTLRRLEGGPRGRYLTVDELVIIAQVMNADPCDLLRRALDKVQAE